MMNYIVRKGKKEDLSQVHDLIRELAVYEKAVHEVETTIDILEEDGFGNSPAYGFYVAESDNTIVGLALYYYRYSTWKGKLLYLEDLIVKDECRGQGIGRKLMDAVIHEAGRTNCRGVQWQVLDWNESAINFYKKYEPVLDPEWINCRLTYEQIKNYNSTS